MLDNGKLTINPDSDVVFYKAELWGTTLRVKKNGIILIYNVKRAGKEIIDVDFNFIDKIEFDQTYEYIN